MTELQQKLQAIRRRELETGYLTYENPLRYGPDKEWLIYHNDSGYGGKYAFVHESYDGPGDDRHGFGDTIEACILAINGKILDETPPAG